MTRKIVVISAGVMTTLLALMLAWQFRLAIIYVFISLTFAAALRPLIRYRARKSLLVQFMWLIAILMFIISIGASFYITTKWIFKEAQQLAADISELDEWKVPSWVEDTMLEKSLLTQLPLPSRFFGITPEDQDQSALPTIFGITQDLAVIFRGVFVIVLLSLYWSSNQGQFERLWLSLLPATQRMRAREVWHTMEFEIGSFIRSQAVYSILIGLVLGVGYWMLGSSNPVVLAVAGSLVSLIPFVSVALAIVPPLLIGLFTSLQQGMILGIFTIIVMVTMRAVVKPRLFKQQYENPILTIAILMIAVNEFGILGLLLAPILSVFLQIFWNLLVTQRPATSTVIKFSDIKARQESITSAIQSMDGPRVPLLNTSLERLSHLIERAEPLLDSANNSESA